MCANKVIQAGVNSLAATRPDLSADWHPSLKGDLTPEQVNAGTDRRVWWRCPQGHDYPMAVNNRSRKKRASSCSVCSGQRPDPTTCLATTHAALAQQFHDSLNGDKTSDNVIASAKTKLWWKCELGHEWQATGANRVKGTGCPFCSGQRVLTGWNDMAATSPELAREWHRSLSSGIQPEDVRAGTTRLLWWQCAKGHEWQARGADRYGKRSGYPYCANQKVLVGFNGLMTTQPSSGGEMHVSLNGDITAQTTTARSSKRLWWWCAEGHEWAAHAYARARSGSMCPECRRALRRRERTR